MKTLVIRSSEWMRGSLQPDKPNAVLYNPDLPNRNKCCMGLLLEQIGVSQEAISHVGFPSEVYDNTPYNHEDEQMVGEWRWLMERDNPDTEMVEERLASINDSGKDGPMEDAKRLERIAKILSKHGWAIEFKQDD